MASVELEGVSKRFSPTTLAVDNVHLKVNDREFLVLVGPSGCGKSTTLRLIAGLESCDEGIIRIGDRQVNQVLPKDRDIAMVFQNYALYPHMSVYKNLSFGLQLRFGGGLLSRVISRVTNPRRAAELSEKRREIKKRVAQTAERLGIEKLLKRKPHQLSGGERQRVALGRAIVREPAAFLFDEPLSNLDAKLRNQLRTEIKRLHHELNTTMIYVTHDQIEAMTLGDRIAVMNKGRIQQIGNPLDVYREPKNLFVAGFIGSLPMNLIHGHLKFDEKHGSFDCPNAKIDLGEKTEILKTLAGNTDQIVLGIRPENLSIDPDQNTSSISAQVVSVDRLGDSTVVHLESNENPELDTTQIVMRTHAGSSIHRGHVVSLQLDLDAAHWFDANTGENLQQKQNTK